MSWVEISLGAIFLVIVTMVLCAKKHEIRVEKKEVDKDVEVIKKAVRHLRSVK